MSVPPPARDASAAPPGGSVAPPGPGAGEPAPGGQARRQEITLELPQPGGWRRRSGMLRLLGAELTLALPGVLREPLVLPAGLIGVAAVARGRRSEGDEGRFPILRRVSATRVVPYEHGIEGWVWTSRSGSSLATLRVSEDTPPNLALTFVKPLAHEQVTRCFEADWVRALAERSPLGSPTVPGLLIVVADTAAAEDAFRRFGVLGPLTDREIPPSMRRHLPGDRPANPSTAGPGAGHAAPGSVAPPGMG